MNWWCACGGALTVWLLAACGPLVIRDDARKEYVPLRSAVLELHRDVDIPPERTRVFFQDGQVQSGLDEFRPHCELTVRNLLDQPQTVYSDRFLVTRVLADTVQVATAGNVGQYNSLWFDEDGFAYICTYDLNAQQIAVFRERVH